MISCAAFWAAFIRPFRWSKSQDFSTKLSHHGAVIIRYYLLKVWSSILRECFSISANDCLRSQHCTVINLKSWSIYFRGGSLTKASACTICFRSSSIVCMAQDHQIPYTLYKYTSKYRSYLLSYHHSMCTSWHTIQLYLHSSNYTIDKSDDMRTHIRAEIPFFQRKCLVAYR